MNNGAPESQEPRLRVHSASLEISHTSSRCLEVPELLLSDIAPHPHPGLCHGQAVARSFATAGNDPLLETKRWLRPCRAA